MQLVLLTLTALSHGRTSLAENIRKGSKRPRIEQAITISDEVVLAVCLFMNDSLRLIFAFSHQPDSDSPAAKVWYLFSHSDHTKSCSYLSCRNQQERVCARQRQAERGRHHPSGRQTVSRNIPTSKGVETACTTSLLIPYLYTIHCP